MKHDPLNQFLNLRTTLRRERATILRRLARIESVLAPPAEVSMTIPAPAPIATSAPQPAKAAKNPARLKRSGRIPGQPSLREAVRQLTAAKPLTRAEIVAGLKKAGHKFAEGSLDVPLYKKGNFKRVDGKFAPAR